MARERYGSDLRQAALLKYDNLIDEGASISRAQVEIAHDMKVSVATVQRWVRDRRNQQERESLLAGTISDSLPGGEGATYEDVADYLAQFYAMAVRRQGEFDAHLAGDSEQHLAATLKLAASVSQAVADSVKSLATLAMREGVPANRIASWANIAPTTLRLLEQEATTRGRS